MNAQRRSQAKSKDSSMPRSDLMDLMVLKGPPRGNRNVYFMSFSFPDKKRLALQFQSWSPNVIGFRIQDKNIGFYTNFKGFNQINFNMMNKDVRFGLEYMQHSVQNIKACKFTVSKKF